MSKSQDILLFLLDDAFQTFGGVPEEILTDNMKTVMDETRTKRYHGKVNTRFQHFSSAQNTVHAAAFPFFKTLSDFDFSFQPSVSETQMQEFCSFSLSTCVMRRRA